MPNCSKQKEMLRRVGAVVLFGLMLCFMMVMSWSGPGTVRADGPAMVLLDGTPPPQPDPTPTPQPPPGGVVTSIQKIIHNLKFDSSKISEALSKVFTAAAEDSESERQAELQTWTGVLSQLVQAPSCKCLFHNSQVKSKGGRISGHSFIHSSACNVPVE